MKRIIVLISLISFMFATEWKPSAELNLRWGLSNQSSVLAPLLYWDHSYVNLAGKLNPQTNAMIRWELPPATIVTATLNDLFYEAYLQMGEAKLGKHHAPFGSYMTRTLSDVWSRSFEETNRMGLSTRMSFYDAFRVYAGVFNNGVNDAMTGFAIRTQIIPRPEIVFEQSLLFDQVFDSTGAKVNKIDIHAMAMLDFKGAIVDVDLYRQLAGPNLSAMVFNAGLQVLLSKQLDLAMRFEWANLGAGAVINKQLGVIGGINAKIQPDMTYSVEGQYLMLMNSQTGWVFQNRLSIDI